MKKHKKFNNPITIEAVIIFATILLLLIPFLIYKFNFPGDFSKHSDEWSNFGSFYGGVVSSILTFITFIFLIKTYFKEKSKNTKIQIEQNILKYIDILNEIHNKLFTNILGKKYEKSELFELYKNTNLQMADQSFQINLHFINYKKGETLNPTQLSYLEHAYKPLFINYTFSHNQIKLYMNHIMFIVNYINKNMPEEKLNYLNILLSSLSIDELYCFLIQKNQEIKSDSVLEQMIYEKFDDNKEKDAIDKIIPLKNLFLEYNYIIK